MTRIEPGHYEDAAAGLRVWRPEDREWDYARQHARVARDWCWSANGASNRGYGTKAAAEAAGRAYLEQSRG